MTKARICSFVGVVAARVMRRGTLRIHFKLAVIPNLRPFIHLLGLNQERARPRRVPYSINGSRNRLRLVPV